MYYYKGLTLTGNVMFTVLRCVKYHCSVQKYGENLSAEKESGYVNGSKACNSKSCYAALILK